MSDNRWQAYRAGILNYWYYDEAEFYFADGRLLLRGSNGSGKSVTMQSLITVLLDGVKRADRLDSFGSKSRTMDDYLLGEKEISEYDERTGYLYLEYKRENSDQYITTGIGLHARRGNSKVDFWGFVLQNGRRIGEDLSLYHLTKNPETGEEQKIPLTRRELENAIGQDGRVTTEQREYMAMVNQYVFGYEDIRKYEELMKLLIQLRSPKLSRDFKPSVIYEILNASLPTLSDEDLRPLAETLENMEKTRLAIEQLKRERAAFQSICRAYNAYNTAVLAERGLAEADCRKAFNRLAKEAEAQQEDLTTAERQEAEAGERLQKLTVEEEALRQEQAGLQEHEAYKAAEKKKEAELQLDREKAEKQRKEDNLLEKRRRELSLQEQIRQEEANLAKLEKQVTDILEDLTDLAEQADFDSHAAFQEGFLLDSPDCEEHFRLWRRERQNQLQSLQKLHKSMLQYEQALERLQQWEQELGEENRRLDKFRYEAERLTEMLGQERERLVKAFYEWKSRWQAVLPLDKEAEIAMAGSLRELFGTTSWLDIQNQLGAVVSEKQRNLDTAIGKVQLTRNELTSRLDEAQADLENLRQTKEAEPELQEAWAAAQQELTDMGIAYVPLYEATEYRKNVSSEMRERLESALLEAGLLNSLLLASNEMAQNLPDSMRGTVLFSGKPVMLAESLLDYLEPVPGENGISKERIADILGSIAVTNEVYVQGSNLAVNVLDGAYRLGSLAGRAAKRPAALFIGKQARENYRRQQIATKEAEIAGLQAELAHVQEQKDFLLAENEQLLAAREAFPDQQDVQAVHDELRSRERDIERQQHRLEELADRQKKLTLKLREERADIIAARGNTGLAFSSAAYEEALAALHDYGEVWQRLTLLQAKHTHSAELFR